MHNPEMLAMTYRLNKIVRDMRHVEAANEEDEHRRDAVMEAIRQVCEAIERDFS